MLQLQLKINLDINHRQPYRKLNRGSLNKGEPSFDKRGKKIHQIAEV